MAKDLRQYTQQTNTRLIIGALILFFIVGAGLIYLIYGAAPAVIGILCIAGGMVPVLLIIVALTIMDWFVKRTRKNE